MGVAVLAQLRWVLMASCTSTSPQFFVCNCYTVCCIRLYIVRIALFCRVTAELDALQSTSLYEEGFIAKLSQLEDMVCLTHNVPVQPLTHLSSHAVLSSLTVLSSTHSPVITRSPVITHSPVITCSPVITHSPVITRSPVITCSPVITHSPVIHSQSCHHT